MLAEKTDPSDEKSEENSQKRNDEHQKHIVIHVALRLYQERGYSSVDMVSIAKGAGISVKEVQKNFATAEDICHNVINIHLKNQADQLNQISENNNPRQRLSLYLDSLAEKSDDIIASGCPITNLYLDLRRENTELADHAAQLLQQRLDWITDQFVLITRVADMTDLPERLTSAIHGVSILAQVTGKSNLIRNQVNQLKSWIRSM